MSSLVSNLAFVCRRPVRFLARLLRWALGLLAALWLLLLTLWLILYALILPNLDRWRPDIERLASAAIGTTVRVGGLSVQTGGWMPQLALVDVRLLDPAGREALHLPRVSAVVSPRSLLSWPPRLEQIHLHSPELALRRDAAGQLWVAGIKLQSSRSDKPGPFSNWLLRQHEVAIDNGRLLWVDEQRPAGGPLQMERVQFVLKNSLRRHEARLDATPPPALGQRFSLRGRVTQPLLAAAGDWTRWSGLLYADLPGANLAALRRQLLLPLQLSQGQGALRVWSELDRGKVREVTLDLGLSDVRLKVSPRVQPIELAQLNARLIWQRLSQGTRWRVRGLQFALLASTPNPAKQWTSSQATLTLRHTDVGPPWQPPAPASLQGGEIQADRIDLGLLAQLAAGLPLGDALHAQLQARRPEGVLRNLAGNWQGNLDTPTRWSLSGRAEALATSPLPAAEPSPGHPHPVGWLGVAGARGSFNANQDGGQATVASCRCAKPMQSSCGAGKGRIGSWIGPRQNCKHLTPP
jgi:uncharacterized protein YhdP